MEPGYGNTALPAHRTALRVATAVVVTSAIAGLVSAVPFVVERGELNDSIQYLCVYNALFIGIRVGALTLAEEVGRAQGPVMRATGATALLFFVAPYVENWAMHFAATVMEDGLSAVKPFEGLAYALRRAPLPSTSTKIGWSQALMIGPFIALAWARTALSPLATAAVCFVVGALSLTSAVRAGCWLGLGVTLFTLPAPAAAMALALVGPLERRLVKSWATRTR